MKDTIKIENTCLSPRQFSLYKNYINEAALVPDYPIFVLIEPTNNCNFNCIMCPRKKMTRPIGNMDFNLFKKIIDDVQGKVEFIWLHFFGEPLMNKDIFNFINYAGGKGMTLGMSTNGFFLNEGTAEKLLDSKLDLLLVSIDSLSEEKFKKIRVGGDINKILKNIDYLLKSHREHNSSLNIVFSMINLSLNLDEIGKLRNRWSLSSGINFVVKPFDNFANQDEDIIKLNTSESNNEDSFPCVEPWRGFAIGWDGCVVPCCYDFDYKYIIGDMNTSSIMDLWNSQKMQSFRKMHTEKMKNCLSLCKLCESHGVNPRIGASFFSCFNPSRQETFGYFNKGLYPSEIIPIQEIIWTQKDFTLLIQDRFNDARIHFRNENPNHASILMSVKLFNKECGKFEIMKNTEILLITPKEYSGRLLRYEFSLNHDWIPKKCGFNDDIRSLGVIIERIEN